MFVPKVESAGIITALSEAIGEMETERGIDPGTVRLVPMIETPQAVLRAGEIAAASPRNVALILGSEDFATAMGMEPSAETLHHAKLAVATAAKGAGLLALGLLDSVADFTDRERTRALAERSARFGFDGATCVHPALVDPITRAFTPSKERAAWARGVLHAMEDAWSKGQGAARFEGKMIDKPMIDRAKTILERLDRAHARDGARCA